MLVVSIPHTDFTGSFRLIGTGTLTLPGEVPPLSWELTIRPLAPSVLGLRPKPPPSRREVLRRAAAVNSCTVQMFSSSILLGNDTGRVREVTITDQPGAK